MSSRRMEFFIGMMVIGIIAGVFVMAILFGSEKGFFVGASGGQRMTIVFQKGSGISQNSLVLKNGIKIGRVYSVELIDEVDRSEVHVSFELEPQFKIYSNEYAKINRTLLGDASIEFVDDPNYVGEVFEIGADDLIPGQNTGDLMGTVSNIEGDLAQALQNINKASEGVTLFMQNINAFLGDDAELNNKKERLQSVFDNLSGTMTSIKSLADNLDLVVSDPEIIDNIRKTTSEAPQLLEQMNQLSSSAQSFIGDAGKIGADVRETLARAQTTFDLVDKNLDNLDVFTSALSDDGTQMMGALNSAAGDVRTSIGNIRSAVDNIAELAETLNEKIQDPNSTFGVLAGEDAAKSLRNIIKNAEEITQKMYPIMDDARVFTNKIAHKPSSLVWDRTTSKGSLFSGVFGKQTLSPTGGVSSPLYRQTAAGARIRERNYYEPAADEEFMTADLRDAYQGALDELDATRSYEEIGAGSSYSLLPTASRPSTGLFGKKSCALKTGKMHSSLASLWGAITGRGKDACEDAIPLEALEAYQNVQGPYDASFVNYVQDANGQYLAQPIYDAGASFQGIETLDLESYDASPTSGGSSCAAPSCAIPSCNVPTCDAPTCAPLSEAPSCEESISAKGYSPKESIGGYTRPNNNAQSLGPYAPEDGETIEELPTSINRVATPKEIQDAEAFEDDGLPLEFVAPATL